MIENLESAIYRRGKKIFDTIRDQTPSLFDTSTWNGKLMDWSMQNESFKVQLLRFVDVFPSLKNSKQLVRHIQEYFDIEDSTIPKPVKWGSRISNFGGAIGGKIISIAMENQMKSMSRQFIIGETIEPSIRRLSSLRDHGYTFIVDVLGEATVNEQEAETYMQTYLALLTNLHKQENKWLSLPSGSSPASLDYGYSPKVHIAVKATALYSQCHAIDFENSVQAILKRMECIFEQAIKTNAFMCLDMESYEYKDVTLEVFRRLRTHPQFRDYPHLGLALQAYLKDTEEDVNLLMEWARSENVAFSIRLVKGAYWDFETVYAQQQGWQSPVFRHKAETDYAFEKIAQIILMNHKHVRLDCGSHNIRSIAAVLEMAKHLGVPASRYEFQVLYGMAEPVRKAILDEAGQVRLYCPFGEVIPGMAYLVRRLLENTSNESFLRNSFSKQLDTKQLLASPKTNIPTNPGPTTEARSSSFRNEPLADFIFLKTRHKFTQAIQDVRNKLGLHCPLIIGGKEIKTRRVITILNPNNTEEAIGSSSTATSNLTDKAISTAKNYFPTWSRRSPLQRIKILRRAAELMRQDVYKLAAWEVLEVGKQWSQAYADITEAIDFLEYYSNEMLRLAKVQEHNLVPGETNDYQYYPLGVCAVIAPWNFPIAISCGMTAAALATGNTVVFKPSERSPITAYLLVKYLYAAGIPKEALHFVPGYGHEIGDYLVEHTDIHLIAFTGSLQTGLRIQQKASVIQPNQEHLKRVLCEMGGKNAIIVDDDADLDQAIPAILDSAFAFQGQKCSACSRLIVLETIYEALIERLAKAARDLAIGPAEYPSYTLGAVIDAQAQKTILDFQKLAQKEGHLIYKSKTPTRFQGYFVPIMIVDQISPENRIAQEEVFGPLLAVMKANDFDQAIEYANSTRFALTAGIFSRSPHRLERARHELQAGNLYLNRGCTGALVGRQAFGGFKMSGGGTKAGGPDYLLHFMQPKTITENTMRRGFTPES
ncbi:MAG: proline dehydrogenase family protein [Verrucomicrobiota bacterium]